MSSCGPLGLSTDALPLTKSSPYWGLLSINCCARSANVPPCTSIGLPSGVCRSTVVGVLIPSVNNFS